MRAPDSTPTVSSSSSANRRCTLVAASARATSSSPLRPPIEGVRFSSRTRIRPAHPAAVSSPSPSLSTELKTHQLFLPCLGNTAGESRNTLVNTRRGVTVVSRLRAPGGEAGRSECRSSSVPAFGSRKRMSARRCCRPEAPGVSSRSLFPCPLILCDGRLRLVLARSATSASGTVLCLRHQRCSVRSTWQAG